MSDSIVRKGEWFHAVSRISRRFLDFFDSFSAANQAWFRQNGSVKHPSFRIKTNQRSSWTSENPMRAFWPEGLMWFPDAQKTRQGEYLYYTVAETPNNLKPKYINKHPHVVREALQLLADLLDRNTPIFCLAEKMTLKISKDGHLVVFPSHKVIFNPSMECNYADLADISKLFPQDSIKHAREDVELLHQVAGLLKDSNRKAALAVLAAHGVTPTQPVDPADQELDLCGVKNSGEMMQRLAEHPRYQHMVQDEYDEPRKFPELKGYEDDPMMIRVQEILAQEQFEEFNKLGDLFGEEEDLEVGQTGAELMDLSDHEEEQALFAVNINGIDFQLNERDLESIYLNHLKSTAIVECEILEITRTKWQPVQSLCPLNLADESYQRIYDQHLKDSAPANCTFVPAEANSVAPTKDDWRMTMKRSRQEEEEEAESSKRIKA